MEVIIELYKKLFKKDLLNILLMNLQIVYANNYPIVKEKIY